MTPLPCIFPVRGAMLQGRMFTRPPFRGRQCKSLMSFTSSFFFFQAEDGIRDYKVTGVQTCALPIYFILVNGPQAIHSFAGRLLQPQFVSGATLPFEKCMVMKRLVPALAFLSLVDRKSVV